ncbi:MAG: serine/threonine-protein kinase [Gemmataceae bacterium]
MTTPSDAFDPSLSLLERFDRAWQQHGYPDLTSYLPGHDDPARRSTLLDLIRIDLEYRWKSENGCLIEEYLARHPEVAADPDALVELIAWEYELRQRLESAPTVDEYARRFPQLAEQLAERLARIDVEAAPASRPGPVVRPSLPGYVLEEEVGQGGMGTVYRAREESLQREVAVKLLRDDRVDPGLRQRFVVEARITGQLQHPGIPAIHELGTLPDGRPFLAMKLVRGRTLQALLAERSEADHERGRFLAIFEQICQAVGYAHANGVIHRDLKPGNVMVGAFGEVQVMDWGLARVMGSSETTGGTDTAITTTPTHDQTQAGTILGTPAYMAPEQARGERDQIDARSDVFGLGAILYQILTGEMLYRGSAMEVVQRARRADLAEALGRLASSGVESELVALAQRCLAALPAERPADAGVVAAEVGRLRAAAEERARRAEQERAAALVRESESRKRRRVWLALAAVLFAGVIGTTLGMIQARNFAEAEHSANLQAQQEKINARVAEQAEKAAKVQAQLDRDRKEVERRYAQAIADFVQFDFLALTSVEGQDRFGGEGKLSLHRNTTLRELLDRAAAKLDQRQDLDPRTEADLRWMIGVNYRAVGQFERAVIWLEKCVALREKYLGPLAPPTLEAQNSLGVAYRAAGRLSEARAVQTKLRDTYLAQEGPQSPRTLSARYNVALIQHLQGNHAEALAEFTEVSKLQASVLGAQHADTLRTLNALAATCDAAGKLSQAIALYEDLHKRMASTLGATHRTTLSTLGNLGNAYYQTGKLTQAVALHERVLEGRKSTLEPDHPDTLLAMNNLAGAYCAARRFGQAIPLFEQVRDLQIRTLGSDHPDTLTTLNNLAVAYHDCGKLSQAITLYEQVRAIRMKKGEAGQTALLTTLNNLAMAYQDSGKPELAFPILDEVRTALISRVGREHPATILTTANLASNLQAVNQLPRALPLFEEAAVGLEKLRFQHPHCDTILPNTITACEQARQLDRAEHWRRKWLAVVKARSGATHADYAVELVGLGGNLVQQRKWTEAEVLLREALAILSRAHPSEWATLAARSLLGESLAEQKRYTEAEPLLVGAMDEMKKRAWRLMLEPNRRPLILAAIDRLIQLYTATSRPDEVKKWQAERAKYAVKK